MYKEYSAKYGSPIEGDILVTGVGTLGETYLVKKGDKFYFKDGNIIWLKPKITINPNFVLYAFKSRQVKSQIQRTANAAVVGTLTINNAKKIKIPSPNSPPNKKSQQCWTRPMPSASALSRSWQNTICSPRVCGDVWRPCKK